MTARLAGKSVLISTSKSVSIAFSGLGFGRMFPILHERREEVAKWTSQALRIRPATLPSCSTRNHPRASR